MDIAAWLRDLGLERYADAFEANAIDHEVLSEVTEADLEKLGVLLGHRKKLLKAIADLAARAGDAAPASAAEAAPRTDRATEAERRQLTVMFVDLVGSTALAARLDPEDMREVIRAYQEACAEVVRRFDGHVAKFMGDGVLAYFGWPRAHEDDAERAVRAGLRASEAVEPATPAGGPLAARVGIATGQVVVGDLVGEGAAQEEAVVGETPNLAARLQGLAEPGSVVIAGDTRRLVGDLFELADLGPRRLKGFAEPSPPIGSTARVGPRAGSRRSMAQRLTPLVGREQELALLLERWAGPRTATVRWCCSRVRPGIGKSRLTRSAARAPGRRAAHAPPLYCSPYHTNSALYPVGEAARAGSAVPRRGFRPETRLDKLEAVLAEATGPRRGHATDRRPASDSPGRALSAADADAGGAKAADVRGAGRAGGWPRRAAGGAHGARRRPLDRSDFSRAVRARDRSHPAPTRAARDHLPAGVRAALYRPSVCQHTAAHSARPARRCRFRGAPPPTANCSRPRCWIRLSHAPTACPCSSRS